MDFLPYIGSGCLGAIIAYWTGFVLRRISPKEFKVDLYKALVGNGGGFAGNGIFSLFANKTDAIWFYPIGLVIGFIIYIIVAVFIYGEPPGRIAYGKIEEKK